MSSNVQLLKVYYVDWNNLEKRPIWIVCDRLPSGKMAPIRLGKGRFAQVVMATYANAITEGIEILALKFLLRDDESLSFSRNARARYFAELTEGFRLRTKGGSQKRVVTALGVSRLNRDVWEDAYDKEMPRAEEESFTHTNPDASQLVDEVGSENQDSINGSLEKSFVTQVQGEFFVMRAEEGSLEDFLIDPSPWSERRIFDVDESRRGAFDDLVRERLSELISVLGDMIDPKKTLNERDADRLATRSVEMGGPARAGAAGSQRGRRWRRRMASQTDDVPALSALLKDVAPSGLSILKFLGRYSPAMRDNVAVELWLRAAEAVKQIHSIHLADTDGVPLAHRDIKFGNFLFSPVAGQSGHVLTLTDFGFAAPAAAGEGTYTANSPREIGMMALGSRLFRAPEQRDVVPPFEVRFRVRNPREVEIFGFGDTEINRGDIFESKDVAFVDNEESDQAVASRKVRVLSAREEGEKVFIELEDEIKVDGGANHDDDLLGNILPAAGQHTDVFALGCVLYFLASGGRSPETFFDVCLRNEIAPEVNSSCLSLALSLCGCDANHMAEEYSAAYLEPAEIRGPGDLAFDDVAPQVRQAASTRSGRMIGSRSKRDHATTNQLVRFWRESPTVQRCIRDKEGVALSFPILYEVIRCMVRGHKDSYIRPEHEDIAYSAVDCGPVTTAMVARARRISAASPSLQCRLGNMTNLNALELFVLLRTAWGEVLTDVQGGETEVADGGDTDGFADLTAVQQTQDTPLAEEPREGGAPDGGGKEDA